MTITKTLPLKTEPSGRIYTMADRPADISERAWRVMIEQGTVESSRSDDLLDHDQDIFESDEEYEAFMKSIGRWKPYMAAQS